MGKKIGLMEVKQALKDCRFRDSLPPSFQKEVDDFIKNPGCPCNVSFYRRLLKEGKKELLEYFPGNEIANVEKELKQLSKNNWSIINCHISELESKLKKMGPGRKQIAITRYEDQITVVVNELDILY